MSHHDVIDIVQLVGLTSQNSRFRRSSYAASGTRDNLKRSSSNGRFDQRQATRGGHAPNTGNRYCAASGRRPSSPREL